MKTAILLSFVLAGCSVDLPAGEFSCESDADCISPNACVQNVCRSSGDRCVDDDGDGYGVEGALTECPKCRDEAQCEADCDDSNPGVNPGEPDICDGADNNCSGAPDEPMSCANIADCEPEGSLLPRCEAGSCAYYAPLSIQPGCGEVLTCSAGARNVPPGC